MTPVYGVNPPNPTELSRESKAVHTLCQACNTRCGVRVRTVNGRAVKIDGNPYHPNTMRYNPVDYSMPVKETLTRSGVVCLKGQEGIHWTYDPYRIRVPLKRAGPRGSMKWKPISWDQLIQEVSEGGRIFSDLGEERGVEGFRQVGSQDPIDPTRPELGPKANQVVVFRGRGQPGRIEFWTRWLNNGFGGTNFIAHDAVCANGVQTGHELVTEDKVDQMRVDVLNSRFIVSFGDIYQAGQPSVVPAGSIIPQRIRNKDLKFVVVDPRAGNAVTAADKWIPILPGADSALVLGMSRWILENNRYDASYLENPNQKAAEEDGETTWTDATHLVIVDNAHPNYLKFLRAQDIGDFPDADKLKPITVNAVDQKPVLFDQTTRGVLAYSGAVTGKDGKPIAVKTAFLLYKDSVLSKGLEEYAQLSGVSVETIVWLAQEFTSYGKKVGLLMYRAPATTYGGTYMVLASLMLQMLLGTFNHKGGYLRTATYGWTTGRYDLTKFDKARKKSGIVISREKFAYENTTDYKQKKEQGANPYPARLPWFPLSHGGLWSEVFSSLDNQYPYPAKIVISYFGNPIYSTPVGHKYIETMKDPNKVPLHIAIDVTFGETSTLADYIVPDVTYLEGSLGIMNPYPPNLSKWTGLRSPAVEPLTGRTSDGRPYSAETFLIDVAKKIGLPGYGDDVIPGPDNKKYSLNRGEDYFIRAAVNLAYNAGVPAASDEEVAYVEANYPTSYIGYAKQILSADEYRKFIYVTARGGAFERIEDGFAGDTHKAGTKMLLHFWLEKLATTRHSMTGKNFPGTATWWPAQDMNGQLLDDLDKDYPLVLVSYKMAQHTQSRTMYQKWALELYPQNYVEVSEQDARNLGLKTGNRVRVQSASGSLEGTAKVTKRLRPSVVAISGHYGHWAYGAAETHVEAAEDAMIRHEHVEGHMVKGDPSRGRGIWVNRLLRVDDRTKAAVVDPISGASPTGGVRVKITKL